MALIKKHNAGGKADFRTHITEKLLTDTSLSASEQEIISQGLNKYEASDNDEEYKATTVGSDEEAKSWLNNEHQKFSTQREATTTNITPEEGWKHFRKLDDILDLIVEEDYAGNEDYALKSLGKMTDNNKIKQMLIKKAQKHVGKYVSGAAQEAQSNPKNEWDKITEATEFQNILFGIDPEKEINDDDWEKFKSFGGRMGWRVDELIRSSEELDNIKKGREAKDEKDTLEKASRELERLGMSEEDRVSLPGFSIKNDYEPFEDMPFLQSIIKDKGYTLIGSKDNKTHALIDSKGKIVTDAGGLVTKDQLSPHYGKSWTTGNAGFHIYGADEWESNPLLDLEKELGNDDYDINMGRGIITDDPEFKDYEITAYSDDDFQGTVSRDQFGRRSFNSKYKFSKDGEEFEAVRGSDGNYRVGEDRFTMPKNMSFGERTTDEIKDYNEMYFNHAGSVLSRIYGEKMPRASKKLTLNKVEDTLNRFEQEYKQANADERQVTIKAADAKNIAHYLKHVLKESSFDQVAKDRAEKLLMKFTDFSTKTTYDKKSGEEVMLFNTPLFIWEKGGVIEKVPFDKDAFEKWKNGGIIKSQSGGTTRDYQKTAAKLAASRGDKFEAKQDSDGIKVGASYHDPTGTVADANLLDLISTGASVASFIPGIGAIGGAVSTVADAVNAGQRGWESSDTINLLSNIGFTALAAVGLGAAKGFKVAGKVGQIANKTNKLGKVGKAVDKARKIGATAMKSGTKAVSSAQTLGTSARVTRTAGIAAKRAARMGEQATLDSANKLINIASKTDSKKMAKLLKGDLAADMARVIETASVKTSLLGRAGQGTVQGVKQIATMAPSLLGNTAKYGFGAVQVGSGIKGALGVGSSIAEEGNLIEGIKKSQIADVRNVLQTTALGYGFHQNKLGAKAIKNRTKSVFTADGKPTSTIDVVGKDGTVIKSGLTIDANAGIKDYNPGSARKFYGKAAKKLSKKDPTKTGLDNYKAILKKSMPESQFNTVAGALDKGATIKVSNSPGTVSTTLLKDLTSKDPKEVRETLRAQRILERGDGNYFTSWLGRDKNKVYTESEYNKLFPASGKVSKVIKKTVAKTAKGARKSRKTGKNIFNMERYDPTIVGTPDSPQGKLFQKKGGVLSYNIGGSFDNPYNSLYNRKLNKGDAKYKMGETPNFGVDNTSFFDRQLKERNASLGLHTGKETSKYDWRKAQSSVNTPIKDPDVMVKNYEIQGHDRTNKYRDYTFPLQALRKHILDRGNEASARNLIKGTQYTPSDKISNVYTRITSPMTMYADKQAGEMNSLGKRMSLGTSDLIAGNNSRMSAFRQGLDIKYKAQLDDVAYRQKRLDADTQMNFNIDNYNNQLANRDKAGFDKSNNTKFNIWSQLDQQNAANTGELIRGATNHFDPETRAFKDARDAYRHEASNPNISGMQEFYRKNTSPEVMNKMKLEWDESQKARKALDRTHVIQDYTGSQPHTEYMKHMNREVAPLIDLGSTLGRLRDTLAMFTGQ